MLFHPINIRRGNLEAGLDIARAADMQNAGTSVAAENADAIMKRIAGNTTNGMSTGSISGVSVGVWGQPLYSNVNGNKAKINGTDYNVKAKTHTFGGIIGADLTWDALTVGAAFNIGSGESKADRFNIKTKNKFDYVGGALYASYKYDNFTFGGVAGYTSIDNDVKQNMAVTYSELAAKPKSHVWNAGVEAKYTFNMSNGIRLIPSLGLEWYHYNQGSYTSKMYGLDQVHVKSASNNQVRLPIGLAVNKDFNVGSGILTPEAHVRYIPSFGGKMNTTASLVNLPTASGTMTGISPDHHTGEVGLALTGKFSNVSLSAGYDFQFSKSRNAHQVNAMLRYQF